MDAMKTIDGGFLILLKAYRGWLTAQQYRTLRGRFWRATPKEPGKV